MKQLQGYRTKRDRIARRNAAKVDTQGHLNLGALQEQMRLIREAGAEPVYYTGPRLAASPMSYALAREGVLPRFLGFNQPDLYPGLYAEERRFDNNHLNRVGSEEFSRALAEAFADTLDGEGE